MTHIPPPGFLKSHFSKMISLKTTATAFFLGLTLSLPLALHSAKPDQTAAENLTELTRTEAASTTTSARLQQDLAPSISFPLMSLTHKNGVFICFVDRIQHNTFFEQSHDLEHQKAAGERMGTLLSKPLKESFPVFPPMLQAQMTQLQHQYGLETGPGQSEICFLGMTGVTNLCFEFSKNTITPDKEDGPLWVNATLEGFFGAPHFFCPEHMLIRFPGNADLVPYFAALTNPLKLLKSKSFYLQYCFYKAQPRGAKNSNAFSSFVHFHTVLNNILVDNVSFDPTHPSAQLLPLQGVVDTSITQVIALIYENSGTEEKHIFSIIREEGQPWQNMTADTSLTESLEDV